MCCLVFLSAVSRLGIFSFLYDKKRIFCFITIWVYRERSYTSAIVLNGLVHFQMFNWVGKKCLGSFCFRIKIDQKGLTRWLGLVKLLWVLFQLKKMVKKEYCSNEGLGQAWDCIRCSIYYKCSLIHSELGIDTSKGAISDFFCSLIYNRHLQII